VRGAAAFGAAVFGAGFDDGRDMRWPAAANDVAPIAQSNAATLSVTGR